MAKAISKIVKAISKHAKTISKMDKTISELAKTISKVAKAISKMAKTISKIITDKNLYVQRGISMQAEYSTPIIYLKFLFLCQNQLTQSNLAMHR